MNALSDFWTKHAPTIDVERFRASPYFLDARGYPYGAVVDLLAERGIYPHHLVERFGGEDGAFGCETERIACGDRSPTVVASRDLLDSALELDFLERTVERKILARGGVLDVGAGYGRLAHRMTKAFSEHGWTRRYVCTDAVEISRHVCRRYLSFRHALASTRAPDDLFDAGPFDLAINVHSWSECDLEAISWWLTLLDAHQVRRLFIVPHWLELCAYSAEHGGGCGDSYREELERRGWRETARWSRMLEPVHFSKHYYLFQR